MKKLYLHIGTPKTGTTAIQSFCYVNRNLLAKDGIQWPVEVETRRFADAALPQSGNIDKIFTFKNQSSIKEKAEHLYHMIEPYAVSLVSCEHIWIEHYRNIPDIIKFLYELNHELEILVIVYLRNQADYFESLYREHIETYDETNCYTEVVEYFLRNKYAVYSPSPGLVKGWNSCDYYGLISSIEKALGQNGKLLIGNYNNLKNNDIIENFFDMIGITITDEYERNKHWANPSLDAEMLEIKRVINLYKSNYSWQIINSVFMSDPFRWWLSEEVGKRSSKEFRTSSTYEQRCQIWNYFREDNRKLSKEFFGKDEDLFAPPSEDMTDHSDNTTEEKQILEKAVLILSGAILEVDKKNRVLKNELHSLRAEQEKQKEMGNQLRSLREGLERQWEILNNTCMCQNEIIRHMENSRSWKITAPLRKIYDLCSKHI